MGKITVVFFAALFGAAIGNLDLELYNAAMNGNLADLNNALASGADPNWVGQDSGGITALHQATMTNLPAMVKSLLDAGADIELRTKEGWTPLLLASEFGKTDALKTLIDHGADINSTIYDGQTALIIAIANARYIESLNTVEALINANANVRLSDNAGSTALHQTSHLGGRSYLVDIARLLLQNGADIRQQDNKGRTALHDAAYSNRTNIALFLLREGASTRQQDNEGKTPADIAREKGYHQLANILDSATTTPDYDLYLLASGEIIIFIAETLNYALP